MRRAINALKGLPMSVTKPLTTDSQTHGQTLAAVFTAFLPTVGGHCSPRSSCHREEKRLLITGTFASSTGRQATAASVNSAQIQNRCRLGVVANFRSDYPRRPVLVRFNFARGRFPPRPLIGMTRAGDGTGSAARFWQSGVTVCPIPSYSWVGTN